MTGLWREEGFGSTALDPEGLQAVTPTTGEVLAASFGEGFDANPAVRSILWARDQIQSLGQPMLSPDEANREYGIAGVLSFDKPIAAPIAAHMHEARRVQQLRADTVERGGGGLMMKTGSMAAGFAASMLDPLNLAAAFIPVVGEARAAALLARAGGGFGRAATRAGIGAVEGSVGMAALQPLDFALSRYEDQDYTMGTALRNIAFGGLLGGVLHPAAGYIGDALKAGPRNPAALQAQLAGHDAREAALRAGIAQHVDGQPVNVAPILDTAQLGSAFAARNAARGDTGLGNYAAYTPDNLRVELRPEVVELSDLIASNLDDGRINPAFTAAGGLQPRDRTSVPSQAQITEIASRLEPERLQPSFEVGAGAPIVNRQGAVESGNGRVLALGKIYTEPRLADQAAAYRAMIAARGHEIEGMRQPVLVGRRINELTPEETARLAAGGNERATLGMNQAEQALSDVARVARAIDAWRPGGIAGLANRRFVGEFMAHMPTAEGGAMKRSNGELSGAGIARIKSAMMAHAYGDALGPALETMLNGDVAHMKGIAGALEDVAGAWGRMRAMAAGGQIPAGLDITPAIGEAVQLLERARSTGIPVAELLANANMLDGPSPAAVGLLRLMFNDDAMRRPVARARLAELLARYTEQAEQAQPGTGLLGMPETTPADILRAIAGTDQRIADAADALVDLARPGGNTRPEETAASQRATTLAQRAEGDHVGTGATVTPKPEPEPASGPEIAGSRPEIAPEWSRFTGDGPEGLVRLADGSTELGEVHARDGADALSGPIVLARGQNDATTNKGFGLVHIEARHGEQIRSLGYPDAASFVADVAARFNEMRRDANGSLFAIVRDPARTGRAENMNALILRLDKDDAGRWQVASGGPFANRYLEKRKMLRVEPRTNSTHPAGVDHPSTSPSQAISGSTRQLSAQGQSIGRNIGDAQPAFNAVLSPELQEATRAADTEVARVRAEVAAGRLTEADLAELRAADAGVQQAAGDANAYQQAAACLFGNLP